MKKDPKEISISKKRLKISKIFSNNKCTSDLGRYRKRNAYLSCGNPRCSLCHCHKYPKREKTNQEKLNLLKLKEGLDDTKEV